jgi:hypothetical protein
LAMPLALASQAIEWSTSTNPLETLTGCAITVGLFWTRLRVVQSVVMAGTASWTSCSNIGNTWVFSGFLWTFICEKFYNVNFCDCL